MTATKSTGSSKNLINIVIGLWAGVCLGAVVIGVLIYTGIIPLLGKTGGAAADPQGQPLLAELESGTLAPEVPLDDLNGGTVKISDYRGKVVVMNFWATWCGPCIQEMPMFQEYQDRYDGIVVLGVNSEEKADKVNEFLTKLTVEYPILLDSTVGMAREFRINFLPTTIFVDEKGEVRFRHYGIMTSEQMDFYLGTLGVSAQ
jgi:thiol-disulfide isomerase/thioredoxin